MNKQDIQNRVHRTRRIIAEVLTQLLNVPILSGALITYFFFRLPSDIPNRLVGYGGALLFMSLIPLLSLLFYIPGRVREKARIIRRQRIASFVFMIISYPTGILILRLIQAPRIFEAMAVTYTLVTLGLIVLNFILRYKASGHAAGVAGPVAALLYMHGLFAAPFIALIPLTTWARVRAQGHTALQTVVGALLSFGITAAVLWLYGFLPLTGSLY
jgi:membrane-associated phospholipid phosphatase